MEFDAAGDHIIIGAPGNDDGGGDSGHARVFNIENLLATSSSETTNLKVYPTLVKEQFHVSSDQNIEEIHIYSSYGMEVLSISPNALQETLSLGHLSSGVYIVEISISGSKSVVKIVRF